MELEKLNLSEICRTCQSTSLSMRSLFEERENLHQGPRIDEMLMACAAVQVVCDDGLPAQICQICMDKLKQAFTFKQQCEKVDENLRGYAKNMKVNEIKQEFQNSDFIESLTLSNLLNMQSSDTAPDQEAVTSKIDADYIQFMENDKMLLTCQDCSKIFTSIKGLRSHKRIHTGNVFKCSKCDKEYIRLNHLQRHEQSHKTKKVHVCKICKKTVVFAYHLKRHLVTHMREKPFSCNTCNRTFSRVEHLNYHTPKCKGDTVYPCDICNKTFCREDIMQVHRQTHDSQPELPTVESLDNIEEHYLEFYQDPDVEFSDLSDIDDDLNDDNNLNGVLTAAENNGTVKTAERLGESMFEVKLEDPLETEDGNTDNVEIDGIKEEEEEEYGEFPCPICETTFNSTVALDEHAMINHEGLKIYKCNVCDKEFSKANHLSTHMSSHSTFKPFRLKLHNAGEKVLTEKKYECPLCLKGFTTEKYRDFHVRVHNGHKKYNCNTCKKVFPSKSHLSEHMKFHDEHSKKFLCSECGQSFIRNDYLVIHMRRHRGEKPFKCKYCEKGFPRTTDLTVHERQHTGEKPHLCTVCGRGFGRAYNLKLHMRTHTGEKPYRCTYCDAAFAQSNDLKTHNRRHTGERFQCELCSNSFLTGSLLTQHKRAVHSN